MESTTFMAYFVSIVSTINGSMAATPIASTILSTIIDLTKESGPTCPTGTKGCTHGKTIDCIHGICCFNPSDNKLKQFCVCEEGYTGSSCHRKNTSESTGTGMEGVEVTALFSALIGVIVIAFFIAIVALQFKYYKIRKKRSQQDEEIRKSMRVKPEMRRKDDASTRLLRAQPGYSWRQSVKRTTNTSQKSKVLSMSISVPDNLLEIGLTREREKETNRTQNGDGGGGGAGEHEGSERFRLDPANEEKSSSTFQLLQDKDLSTKAV